MPGPPGNGLQIRPREPHSLRGQVCLENTTLRERDSLGIFTLVADESQMEKGSVAEICLSGRFVGRTSGRFSSPRGPM